MDRTSNVEQSECGKFLVVPPIGAQFDDPKVLKRISEALSEEFPAAVFTVADGNREEDFAVYPILAAAEGASSASRIPAEGVIAAISDFLEANFAHIPKPGLH